MAALTSLLIPIMLAGTGPALRDTLALSISVDRDHYYVKERVLLRVTLKNVGITPFDDDLNFDPTYPTYPFLRVEYRMLGAQYVRFSYAPEEVATRGDFAIVPTRLSPGEESSRVLPLAFNSTNGQFVLGSEGDYDFRVSYQDLQRPPQTLESDVIRVHVTQPPKEEQEAAASCTGDIARFAQLLRSHTYPNADALAEKAAMFCERYPTSVFAAPISKGLARELAIRVRGKIASKQARAIYAKLEADEQKRGDRSDADDGDSLGQLGRPRDRDSRSWVVPFEIHDAHFVPAAEAALAEIVHALKANRRARVRVEAHADGLQEAPSVEDSLALSEQRARAVQDALVQRGIARARIRVSALGREMPACMEQADYCYAKNRRAEVSLIR
jgi:outer membrane protein OmpA-like peptidoglycan-associated protein